MPYVKKTLAPGEEYLYRAHFNWTYDVQSWLWFGAGCIPALFLFLHLVGNNFSLAGAGGAYAFFSGGVFVIGAAIALFRYVHKWTTVIAVTSVRVLLKTGMIARTAHEVMLDEVEEVQMRQPFLGHILGYAILAVRGTGGERIEFPALGRPMRVRREIESAIVSARGQGAATPSPDA